MMARSHMVLVVLFFGTFFWQQTCGGPARSLALAAVARAAKIPRSIRAPFRNTEMMTARGFGKRSQIFRMKEPGLAWNLGKRETKYMDEFSHDVDPIDQVLADSGIETFPIDWLATELASSPVLTRSILRRFVDTDRDGIITANELLSGSLPHQSSSAASENNDLY